MLRLPVLKSPLKSPLEAFRESALGRRMSKAIFQPRGPEAGEVFVNQRRVFILPTGAGLTLSAMLLALLLGSINYSLGLGYALTFMVVGVAWVGMFHTFRNLAHLRLRPARVDPVFAGSIAEFRVVLVNRGKFDRYALRIGADAKLAPVHADPAASSELMLTVPVTTARRGLMPMPRMTLETVFPLGLWRAWSYWQPALNCLVYPKPSEDDVPLPASSSGNQGGEGHTGSGAEDFAGIRPYAAGDSPRHIAWKAMARNPDGAQLTKLFEGGLPIELWLDLALVPAHYSLEAALSLLTRWVLEAEARQLRYGLRLGGITIDLDQGEAQRQRCLSALALYGSPVHGSEGMET